MRDVKNLAEEIEAASKRMSLLSGDELRAATHDLGKLVYVQSGRIVGGLRAAANQSRAFEDGARWMRERAAETAHAMPSQILFVWARPGGPLGNGYRPLDGSHVAQAIRALPLQPEGERNA